MQALAPRTAAPSAIASGHAASAGGVLPTGLSAAQTHPYPTGAAAPHHSTAIPVTTTSQPRAEQIARELGIVGYDPTLRQAIELAGSIAPSGTPVLIVGEPGTGKSLLARAIHALGSRRDHPLVLFDNAALAEVLAEQDRLGESTSALVEAEADWNSKLHQAHGGTLFLNEVTALPDNLQTQLLHAVSDREFGHNGHHAPKPDVRFLMSSSENLPSLVEQGRFRQDLYYRISVICLKLPPLRHRTADIESLAEYFRNRFTHEFGKNIVGFTHDALESLVKHEWPGNVRELESVVRRGVILCQGTRITSGHLASSLAAFRSPKGGSATPRPHLPLSIRPLKEALEEPEKRIIIQALQALNWNRQETARVLDINRTTLYKKMKKYGLLVDGPIWVN
jgi:two-component system response regulator HydG